MNRINKDNEPDIRSLIVDSGPMLISLALNYSYTIKINTLEKLLSKVWDKFSLYSINPHDLKLFFERVSTFLTTPHAIGELVGLAKSKLGFNIEQLNDFWHYSIQYLSNKNLKEEFIDLLSINNSVESNFLINKIGLIDTELIDLSKIINLPILTIDKRTLKSEAEKKLIDVIVLDDDIYRFI